MKRLMRLLSTILIIAFILSSTFVFARDASGTSDFSEAETETLVLAITPLLEQLKQYYDITGIQFHKQNIEPDTPNVLYAGVSLQMKLLADDLSALPFFQGICKYTGISSIEAVTVAELTTSLSSGRAPVSTYLAQSMTCQKLQPAPEAEKLFTAITTLSDTYSEYIGMESEFNYEIRVTLDEDGDISDVSGKTEFTYVPLSDFFPESETEMAANGIATLQDTLTEAAQIGDAEIMRVTPLYYRVDARDYANRYSSEATYDQTCPHGRHYINLSKYNPSYTCFCHADCANFVSQAIHAGQIPLGDDWVSDGDSWINVRGLLEYFDTDCSYWKDSTFASCNAGGIIINYEYGKEDSVYHVNMCVHNDTVTHKYSAHNNDHCGKVFTANYWGGEKVGYHVFKLSTTDHYTGGGVGQ